METYFDQLLKIMDRKNYSLRNIDEHKMRTYYLIDANGQGALLDSFQIEIRLCLGIRSNRSKLQQQFKQMLKTAGESSRQSTEITQQPIRAGYLFKPTHSEIHYIKKGSRGDMRMSYGKNFTTDQNQALTGTNIEQAKKIITQIVSKFNRDDEYEWTPVLVDVTNNTYQRFISGIWLDEALPIR